MCFKKSVVGLSFVAATVLAAPSYAVEVHPLFKAGIDFGGDTLVTVQFSNGERENIKANDGFFVGGGISIVNADKTVEGELSLSYKFDDITASNGDVEWTRLPLDALVFYRFEKVRLGGGLTYHLSPELEGSGVIGGLNVKFKDSLGFLLQADYRATDKIAFGVRYTMLDYQVEGSSAEISSNGVGLTFSASF